MKNQSLAAVAPAYVLPNLLIAGAQKAGTTNISNNLASHPQTYLPPEKELMFFSDKNWAREIGRYARRFPFKPDVRYWIDATPGYFWTGAVTDFAAFQHTWLRGISSDPSAPKHDVVGGIHTVLGPDIRLILTLRHPVRRAISAFYHHFRMARIRSGDRLRSCGHRHGIIDIGMYSHHLRKYLAVFRREQIKIVFFEEYVDNPQAQMDMIYDWLGIARLAVPAHADKAGSGSNEGIKLVVERMARSG